jgi:hypothetical protein
VPLCRIQNLHAPRMPPRKRAPQPLPQQGAPPDEYYTVTKAHRELCLQWCAR